MQRMSGNKKTNKRERERKKERKKEREKVKREIFSNNMCQVPQDTRYKD